MNNDDCFICKKHKGEAKVSGGIIFEDEFVYVGHIGSGDKLVYKGYLIIDLKRHVPGLGDMTIDESRAVGEVLNRVSKALKVVEKAEHIYCYVQGDAVPHLHIHVIPRYPNTPEEFWNPMRIKDWSGAPKGEEADIIQICIRIKEGMACL